MTSPKSPRYDYLRTTRVPAIKDALGMLFALLLIAVSIWSLVENPPKPPPEYANCPAHDPGNPWCIR